MEPNAQIDFELEDADTGSEVFAVDEEDVDQNAATALGPAVASVADEDEDALGGWDVECEGGAYVMHGRSAISAPWADSRPLTDRVHFSLTAPATLEPGASYALDVWAYLDAQRTEVMALGPGIAGDGRHPDEDEERRRRRAGHRPDRATGDPDLGGG